MSFMCFLLLLLVFLCDCNCVDSVFRRKGIVRCLLKLVNKSNNNTRNSYDNSDSYDHSIDTKNHLVVLSSKEIVTLPAMNSNSSINSNSNSNSSGNSNSYSYSDSGGNSTSNSTSNSALNSNQESDMTNLLPTTINNSNTVTNRTTKLHLFGTNYKNSKQIVKLVVYFLLMYFFTIVYNVSNKKVLNELPIPITIATIQLFLGIPLFLPIWVVKPPKGLHKTSLLSLVTIAIAHALGNLATIISLQSGSVSFTHVIKSSEPLFTALLSIVLLNSYYNMEVYLSLMPIVFGVGIASFQEVTFTWIGFISGLLSNLFYQLRIVLSKKLLTNKTNSSSSSNSKAVVPYGQHSEYDNSTENNNSTRSNSNKLSPSNLFRVLTLLSFFILLFPAITLEKNLLKDSYLIYMRMETINRRMLLSNLLLSGFSYYIYNEITFWIIELVHPITQAVGNTIKRIVIIIAAVLLLNAPINGMGILGASIAIAGSFLYALAFQRFNSSK